MVKISEGPSCQSVAARRRRAEHRYYRRGKSDAARSARQERLSGGGHVALNVTVATTATEVMPRLRDGRELYSFSPTSLGSHAQPMPVTQVVDKFQHAVEGAVQTARATEIVLGLPDCHPDLRALAILFGSTSTKHAMQRTA